MTIPIKRLIETGIKYGNDTLLSNWSIADIGRMMRNALLIIINGYSYLIPLLLIIFFFILIKNKKWTELVFFLSFLIPFSLTAKFWYGGLFGRYGSFVAYGLALMIGLIPNKIIYWLMISSIVIAIIPTFIVYQQKPIPLIQRQLIEQVKLTDNDLIILSDYQRPQLPYKNALYINGDKNELSIIEKKINQALKNNQRVLITEQAVNFPYWQYDGQQIHIISKGDKNKAVLKKFLATKKLTKIVEDKHYSFLSIYQIK